MKPKLKAVGRYFELPLIGSKVVGIIINGKIRLSFNNILEDFLDIDGEFRIVRHGRDLVYTPNLKEAWTESLNLFNQEIVKALTLNGMLELTFSDRTELIIEDGPYENWHYKKQYGKSKFFWVHGGVGQTTSFL